MVIAKQGILVLGVLGVVIFFLLRKEEII